MVSPLLAAAAGAYAAKQGYDLWNGDDGPGTRLAHTGIFKHLIEMYNKEQAHKNRPPETFSKHSANKYDKEAYPLQSFKDGGGVDPLESLLNKEEEDQPLIVHLNKDECKLFDLFQGGAKFIPVDDQFSSRMHALGYPIQGQIRDYRPLEEVFQNPEVQQAFSVILKKMDEEGDDSPELEHYYEIGKEVQGKFQNEPEPDPELNMLAGEGVDGDTELGYMPRFVCDFLDSIRGEVVTNPKTGFPQYGGWRNFGRSVLRVGATVAGAFFGGPLGAMAGNAAGRMLTGQSPGNALMGSLPNALYTAGAQGIGSLLGSYGPASLAPYGTALAGWGGNLSTGSMLGGLLGTGGAAATGAKAAGAAGGAGAAGAAATGANAAGAAGTTAATSAGGGLFGGGAGGLSSWALPGALALTALGVSQMKKGHKKEQQEWEKENKRTRAEREELRQRNGMYEPLSPLQDTYENRDKEMMDYYRKKPDRQFKRGGSTHPSQRNKELLDLVDVSESYKGKGAGQADNLKKKLPVNGYIVPADVVAMVGQGNTNAGQDILQKMEARLKSKYKGMRVNKKLATLKANTSDGEVQHSPLYVTLLGQGNNDRGAKKLDQAIHEYRLDKTKNGPHLQPKAKPFDHYLR